MNTNSQNNPTTQQAFADLLNANYGNMNDANLRHIAYIGYIASQQGGHQHAACRNIYQQLMARRFKAIDENCGLFADLVTITIENLRILNHGTLDNPYYYEDFFNALEAILPTTKEASRVLDALHAQFGRGWKVLPKSIQQTA